MEYATQYKIFALCVSIVTILFLFPVYSHAQQINIGSLKNLSDANGFGNIYLGENINLIPKSKLTFMDNDSIPDIDGCIKYEYRDLDRINSDNNLNLDLVGIRVYKKKIINIYLFFRKEDGYQIFKTCESNFGNYTQRLSDFNYDWETSNVKLHLEYDKEDLGVVIYSCKKLYQEIDDKSTTRLAAQ